MVRCWHEQESQDGRVVDRWGMAGQVPPWHRSDDWLQAMLRLLCKVFNFLAKQGYTQLMEHRQYDGFLPLGKLFWNNSVTAFSISDSNLCLKDVMPTASFQCYCVHEENERWIHRGQFLETIMSSWLMFGYCLQYRSQSKASVPGTLTIHSNHYLNRKGPCFFLRSIKYMYNIYCKYLIQYMSV